MDVCDFLSSKGRSQANNGEDKNPEKGTMTSTAGTMCTVGVVLDWTKQVSNNRLKFLLLFEGYCLQQAYVCQLKMPKNKGKGGKNVKRGKNQKFEEARELIFKEDGQEYAQVLKMLARLFVPDVPSSRICSKCWLGCQFQKLSGHT